MCRWEVSPIKDWRFLDALKRETDRSLAREPERKPWGKRVEETIEAPDNASPDRGGHGQHGRPGKGGQTERHSWSDREYANARADLKQQAADYARQQQREAEEAARSLREQAAERRAAAREVREAQRAARDDDRQGRPPPGYRS
jgi:hypothetical protein